MNASKWMQIWLGCLLLSFPILATAGQDSGTGFHIKGQQILAPNGKPITIRGFNVLWWVPTTAKDADDIKGFGVNCVRYMYGYVPTGKFDPSKVAFIKEQVHYYTSRGIWVIVVVHDFRKDAKGPYDSADLNREYLDMWDYVIGELKDEPYIAAWEPINEPHDSPADTVSKWYRDVIHHFRSLDPKRPIVVEGTGYSWPEGLVPGLWQTDSNLIYSFHTYGPWEYTSQTKDKPVTYPGKWSRAALAKAIEPALQFRKQFNVPVWCGEWGVPTHCPGYKEWIQDVASILEEDRLPWTYWGWALKPTNPTDDTFDVNPQKPEVYELMKDLFGKLTKQ